MAWRYEFYFLVENKIHIFAPPCNILYSFALTSTRWYFNLILTKWTKPAWIFPFFLSYFQIVFCTLPPLDENVWSHWGLARHFSAASRRASGRIWLRTPPRTLEVASVARIRGWTTVAGTWRSTPPTAPVTPFCSCSSLATCTIFVAVCPSPWKFKGRKRRVSAQKW